VDPLFKQTTARFDEMSLGSLMSSRLSINSELLIQLDSQMPQFGLENFGPAHTFQGMGLIPQELVPPRGAQICQDLDDYLQLQRDFIESIVNRKT